jgi:hypothetical protein
MMQRTRNRQLHDAKCSGRFRPAMFLILSVVVWVLAGCANSSKVAIGPVAFVNANGVQQGGAVTTMSVGATTYVDAAVANDPSLLGVDWTAVCGSALPPGTPLPPGETEDQSCGYFTPVHTASAPVPDYATSGAGIVTFYTAPAAVPSSGTVTLYASATADESKRSSVTLTITGPSISIALTSPLPPSALQVGGTVPLKAVVSNDSVAGGVNWTVTCGASDCGSFNPTETASGSETIYTAPSAVPTGGTVTLVATSVTDHTKSVSAVVTIQQ